MPNVSELPRRYPFQGARRRVGKSLLARYSCSQLWFVLTSHHDFHGNFAEKSQATILDHNGCGHPFGAVFCDQGFFWPKRRGLAGAMGEKSLVEDDGVVCVGTIRADDFLGLPEI